MGVSAAWAQSEVAERLYVATDRSSYVAGQEILCSVFCFDASNGQLSDCSRVAYIELLSSEGSVKFSKVSLDGGRGGGVFTIPSTVPTGNYRLVAYTSQNKFEEGYDFSQCSRVISIFNTLSNDRVQDGVKLVSGAEYREALAGAVAPASSGKIGISLSSEVKMGAEVPVAFNNKSGKAVSFSVSIRHDDGVIVPDARTLVDAAGAFTPAGSVKPGDSDTEGEVIRAKVVGANFDVASRNDLVGIIAVPSGDMYASSISASGDVTFRTLNMYGEHLDMVAEIEGLDGDEMCHLEIESPFVGVSGENLPQMLLSDYLYEKLVQRSMDMQLRRKSPSDTLYSMLSKRPDPLFRNVQPKVYVLDDYVRFPTMQELFVEIILEMRGRQSRRNGTAISVLLDDDKGTPVNVWGNSLMMVDGVPVLEHSRVWDYDPYLIDTVEVYRSNFSIGDVKYGGIANFKTFKKNMPGVVFNDSVRITDWAGVSYPVAFTQPYLYGDDVRQTIWWHPLKQLASEEAGTIHVFAPEYQGDFVVELQGVTEDGEVFYERSYFSVR